MRAPHKFWKLTESHLCNALNDGGQHEIPSAPGEEPAVTRFYNYYNTGRGGLGVRQPAPEALSDDTWLGLVDSFPAPEIGRPFDAAEIARLIYPTMKNLAPGTCPASGTLEPECPYCARYTNQHEAFKSGNGPPPASCPSLATPTTIAS